MYPKTATHKMSENYKKFANKLNIR